MALSCNQCSGKGRGLHWSLNEPSWTSPFLCTESVKERSGIRWLTLASSICISLVPLLVGVSVELTPKLGHWNHCSAKPLTQMFKKVICWRVPKTKINIRKRMSCSNNDICTLGTTCYSCCILCLHFHDFCHPYTYITVMYTCACAAA